MSRPEKMIKPAPSAEQKLPGKAIPAGGATAPSARSTLPGVPAAPGNRATRFLPTDVSAAGLQGEGVTRPATPEESLLPADAVQARRALSLETAELISDHALRLRQTGGNQVSVIVQPDIHTRLRLEMAFDGSVVEAHASVESGDFSLLKACWPELQSRLLDQGVRIAPLTAAPTSTSAWAGGGLPSRREHSPRQTDPAEEMVQPVASVTSTQRRQPVRAARGSNRFDLWA